MNHMDPKMGFTKIMEQLPWKQVSILIQLHTKHVPLQCYLHCIGKAETLLCQRCLVTKEMVYYYLMECPAYSVQCATLEHKVGSAARSIATLLNSTTNIKGLSWYIHNGGFLA